MYAQVQVPRPRRLVDGRDTVTDNKLLWQSGTANGPPRSSWWWVPPAEWNPINDEESLGPLIDLGQYV